MILTGRAADHAQKFEEFEKKIGEDLRLKPSQMTEDEQIALFNITMMFERDKIFRFYIEGCFVLFRRSRIKGKKDVINLMTE